MFSLKGIVWGKTFLASRAQNNSSNLDIGIWAVGTFGGLPTVKSIAPP